MANLFVNLPVSAGTGVGAAVDVSALGAVKTVTVQSAFSGSVIVEFSNEGSTGPWAQATLFTNPGTQTFTVVASHMRVRRAGVRPENPGTPNVDVSANDDGALFADLPAPAGTGTGTSIDVSAFGLVNTVTCLGSFRGTVLIEISEDNTNWSQIMTFTQPGWQTKTFTAQFMRVRREVNVDPVIGNGTPNVDVGAANNNPSAPAITTGAGALIFKPGSTDEGPVVFNDWADLYAELEALRSVSNDDGLYTIVFDNSITSPCVIPAGTYDMSRVTFLSTQEGVNAAPVAVTVTDGAVFSPPIKVFEGNLQISHSGATSPITLADGDIIRLNSNAIIRSTGAAAFFSGAALTAGQLAAFTLDSVVVLGDGTNDVINFPVAGTICALSLGSQAEVLANALNINAAGVLVVTWRNSSGNINSTQPAMLGTVSQTNLVLNRWRIRSSSAASVTAALGDLIQSSPGGGGQTLNLPIITPYNQGQSIKVVHSITSNVTTLTANGVQTIGGGASTRILNTPREEITLTSDGVSNWIISDHAISFGQYYQTAFDADRVTTNASDPSVAETLTTPTLPAGTYRVAAYALIDSADPANFANIALVNTTDAANVGGTSKIMAADADARLPWSVFGTVVFAAAGSKVFEVQYASDDNTNAIGISEIRIEFYRVF